MRSPSIRSAESWLGRPPGPPQLATNRCAPSDSSKASVEAHPCSAIFCGGGGAASRTQYGAERRHPLIAPAACLAQRPGAHSAPLDKRGEPCRLTGIGALPARQRPISHDDAVKGSERSLGGRLNAFGNHLLGRLISSAQQAEAVDQHHLFERRPADQPAIVELGRGECPREPRLAASDAMNAALHQKSGSDHSTPGSDPVEPRRRLVGACVEMTGAASERVEQRRAVAAVAARQDVRRIGGPEQDAFTPQVGRPGAVDSSAVHQQPAADDRFGEARALFARGRGGEVAQPGETLELLSSAPACRLRRNQAP